MRFPLLRAIAWITQLLGIVLILGGVIAFTIFYTKREQSKQEEPAEIIYPYDSIRYSQSIILSIYISASGLGMLIWGMTTNLFISIESNTYQTKEQLTELNEYLRANRPLANSASSRNYKSPYAPPE